jgi:hypothetical protein
MTTPNSLVGKIVHATWGYNCTLNDFCLIVKETQRTVLLQQLKTARVSGDATAGAEVPISPTNNPAELPLGEKPFRAQKKSGRDNALRLWAKGRFYGLWDGEPKHYNDA